MTRRHTVIVKLKRSNTGRPWGIRIAGGADLGTPIVVTRSENEALQRGDMIKKIDDYDARDVRHVDAQNLLQNSETIKLVVERSEPSSAARTSSRTTTDTVITASPPTIFRPIIRNGAAATSLSECNTISITTTRFFDSQCCHNNDTASPPQYHSTPLINPFTPRLINFSLFAQSTTDISGRCIETFITYFRTPTIVFNR